MKRKDMRLYRSLILVACAGACWAQQASQDTREKTTVPRLVPFSGVVKEAAGKPVAAVNYALYKDQEGGAPIWMETQNVRLDESGRYTVLLGSTTNEGMPIDLFTSGDARWLGVRPEGQPEQPRVGLVSMPYALKSADAETLGGRPASAFIQVAPEGEASDAAAATIAARAASASPKSTDAPLTSVGGSGTATFIPLWTGTPGKSSTTLGNSVLFQSGTGSTAKVGIGTTNPRAALDIVAPNTGVQPLLFLGDNVGGSGDVAKFTYNAGSSPFPLTLNLTSNRGFARPFAIVGGNVGIGTVNPGAPLQVTDRNDPTASAAIAGDCSSGSCAGVFGDALSTIGATEGVFGQVLSSGAGAAGVKGEANATTGLTFGVAGFNISSGTFAAGVAAANTAGSGKTFGLSASSSSLNGTGTFSIAAGESGSAKSLLGCCPIGVWGDTGSNAGGAAGLAGTADDARAIFLQNNSPSGVPTAFAINIENTVHDLPVFVAAGVSGGGFRSCTFDTEGNMACNGLKSAVVPVDNGQHEVALYAVEAPQNWFEDFGSARLASGAVTVNLDRTFAQTVNTASDYHVFLTPEGDCRGLYVDHKTAAGFEVHELAGGQSNVEFAYRVVALRRGYENVRLKDMTERMNNIKAAQPKATPGTPFILATPGSRSVIGEEGTVERAELTKAK